MDRPAKDVTLKISGDEILSLADKLHRHYKSEDGRNLPSWVIARALADWLTLRVDQMVAGLGDSLLSPGFPEGQEFRRHMDESLRNVRIFERDDVSADVFSGRRQFSFDRLAAMTAYLTSRGRSIYKTKLNKLLFYCDFVNYYLHGNSISGSKYVHLPFGPVPDRYESTLAELESRHTIRISKGHGHEVIAAGEGQVEPKLNEDEMRSIDWVLENLGSMTAGEISEYSHQEKAYKDTRAGEFIAYEYAKFFMKLPEKIGTDI
jgi:hypothetical protein